MKNPWTKFSGAIAFSAVMFSLSVVPSLSQSCTGSPKFSVWAKEFIAEAKAAGISASTLAAASKQFSYDKSVVQKDRRQGVFSQSFLQFSDRMVAQYRLDTGRRNLKKMKSTFSRIENQFGVPGAVISAFWGLETDFGANIGKESTLRSLSTLAYDCRRPEKFRPQLMDALRLIDNGDLKISQMVGAWAGELGQTQFLPTEYNTVAIDFDGDGKRNLLTSKADALASSANLLKSFGWRKGEPWLQEVRVPKQMNWADADLAIKLPRSQWKSRGVKFVDGSAIPSDNLSAALLLPMGYRGPAFLAYHNFDMFLEWNQSLVYSTTAAYFATRLAGENRVQRGAKIASLDGDQTKQLQRALVKRGYDVGKVDGIIGKNTRAAVKAIQQKLGLPADSYPTAGLLAKLL
ncbi:MAG: lytic murein transglycosylase [Rhizobiaceae bacterium]|nr:lytic murein transglycosylase [Rhizobiaceae bacterium]